MIKYILKRSSRKTLQMSISKQLEVIIKAPMRLPIKDIENFIIKNQGWVDKHLLLMKEKLELKEANEPTEFQIIQMKKTAREYIPKRVEFYSEIMNVSPATVKITSAKTRWGSCSGRNNLCFSFYCMNLPVHLIDYIVVHELAHIKHKNHSKAFYYEIERFMPDYKSRVKEIKENYTIC